jgi:integral membrane sensor domain MASE1
VKSSRIRELVHLSLTNLALLASLTLVYFVAGRLGLRVSFAHAFVTPIWVPSGVAIAAFILLGYQVWPAVLVASFLGHLATLGLVNTSFVIPIGGVLEGLIGAYLVNRFARGAQAFDSAKGVFRFVFFACICAPAINATLGVGWIYLGGLSNLMGLGFIWLTWWLAHGTGILLVAPFLILLLRASRHRLDWGKSAELVLLLLGLIFVCLLVFGPLSVSVNESQLVQVWMCIPFLIWAAFRFYQLEAAGTTLILFGSAIWGTLHGYGSFVEKNLMTSLILLDTLIGVIGTMTLVIAAMVVERRRVIGELLGTQRLLQRAVETRERDLIVTVQTLEVEITGHAQTKRALRHSQERLRKLPENAKLGGKQEAQDRQESLE